MYNIPLNFPMFVFLMAVPIPYMTILTTEAKVDLDNVFMKITKNPTKAALHKKNRWFPCN